MVAIKSQEADSFLTKLPRHVFLYLVFGSDAGLVSERARHILRQSVEDPGDPFQLVRMRGDDVAIDPLRLLDEANTIALFGGRRAIQIDLGGKQIAPALEMLVLAPPSDCTVIVEGGTIKSDSPLRKLVEREKTTVSIECYPDDAKAIARLIHDTLNAAGLAIDADARDALGELLGADRLTTRAELEKLVLYCHGKKSVTLHDVETMIADASALAIDTAINGAFSSNMAAIEETGTRAFAMGNDPNALLAAALWRAVSLHRARLDFENGISSNSNFGGRSGGYDRNPAFKSQMQSWSAMALQRSIVNIQDAITKVRREPRLAEILTIRVLWTLALANRDMRR